MYQIIQPEVIVGLGDKTEYEESQPPFKKVKKLQIKLEDWLGDDLMECYPCYLITEDLKIGLESMKFTGYKIDDVDIIRGEYFFNNYQLHKSIPKFYWLKVEGKENENDLFIGNEMKLFCSDAFFNYLKENNTIKYLVVNPKRNEFDDLLDRMIAESKNKI